jgi:hypothetical protein
MAQKKRKKPEDRLQESIWIGYDRSGKRYLNMERLLIKNTNAGETSLVETTTQITSEISSALLTIILKDANDKNCLSRNR